VTDEALRLASALMHGFANATGIAGAARPLRYLWTDAFAVCNFLGLHSATGRGEYLELALKLVDQVHHVLGRHRDDDTRRGWISGLGEADGERHPTQGGLRIGKELPERLPNEPLDARLEWNRDGQYFHYLTQWMHALHRVSEDTSNPLFDRWAVELAQTAHAAFTRPSAFARRPAMAWKMSIDLSRVLVPSTGQHDPPDAWVTYLELAGTEPLLEPEIRAARELCLAADWETTDPLGIGALLVIIHRLAVRVGPLGEPERALLAQLLAAARSSLVAIAPEDMLVAPIHERLAFRELGLAIGLHALARAPDPANAGPVVERSLTVLRSHLPAGQGIVTFWTDSSHRRSTAWTAHRHINDVMLATSLLPDGYLGPTRQPRLRSGRGLHPGRSPNRRSSSIGPSRGRRRTRTR
jgi:hypothetical protein